MSIKMKKIFMLFLMCMAILMSIVACDQDESVIENSDTIAGDTETNNENSSNQCSHVWMDATCFSPKECSKCGQTSGASLGHTTAQGVCNRCYEYIGVPSGIPEYISNRSINHDDESGYFYFLFSFLDVNEKEIVAEATVDIRIENTASETVYEKTHKVTEENFGVWENSFYGEEWLAASIYIVDSDIMSGVSDCGTFYYTITSVNGISWDEFTLAIDGDLPIKETELSIGQVWESKNEWKFTIDSVQNHYACSDPGEYQNNNLAQYIMITYSYENIGFDYYTSGLDFNFTDFKIYDEQGEIAEFYGCYSHTVDDKYIDIGAQCSGAQIVFGLKNKSQKLKIVVDHSSNYGNQKATYNISVGACTHVEVIDIGKEPTCDVDGLTEGKHCSICEAIILQQKIIKAKGHDYVNNICSICNAPNKDTNEYKYATLKKKADAIVFSCAETVLRDILKNPNTLTVLAENIIDSDEYFRYVVKIKYTAQNSVGGYVTDSVYILLKVNSIMDGTFVYYRDSLGFKYPITPTEKTEFGWNTKPDDFTLDSVDKFENPEEISLKMITAYPQRYEGKYIRIKEELVIVRNDISDKEFYVYLSTGDGKYDCNTDVATYIMYRMCDNIDDCIMLDANYQRIIVEGYVKVYSNSAEAYIEAYNITISNE